MGTLKYLLGAAVIIIMAAICLGMIMENPATSVTQDNIPIKLDITAESSTVQVGETLTIAVGLLDENNEPTTSEVDVEVDILTDFRMCNVSITTQIIIPAGKNSSETQILAEKRGIAIILAKSKGLVSDTTIIAVLL
jgi:hypothetical protein